MENPIEMDDLGGKPLFSETSICSSDFFGLFSANPGFSFGFQRGLWLDERLESFRLLPEGFRKLQAVDFLCFFCAWLLVMMQDEAQNHQVIFWLVVSTHLKNISQNGNFPRIGMNIKDIQNHHPVFVGAIK